VESSVQNMGVEIFARGKARTLNRFRASQKC
jgi:hypothetical protein